MNKLLSTIGTVGSIVLCTILVLGLLTLGIWAYDIQSDRTHTVLVESQTPIFEGAGDSDCGGTQIAIVQPRTTFRAERIRYWKNCATINVKLWDGRKGHIVLGRGNVSIKPPLN